MQNKTDFDVIVAGAGPVGLFLACELALQGVSTLVIEKQPQLPYDAWKDGPLGLRGLNMPSIELLYRRGLLPEVMPNAKGPTRLEDIKFFGHFAGLTIPADKVDVSRWKHILPGPSISGGGVRIGHLIKVLTARALSLGVTLLYSTPVTAYTSTSTSTVQITTPYKTYTASYLIAADGGRSTIRHLTPSLPFLGSEATWTGYAAHASLRYPTTPLNPGFNPTDKGMYITTPSHLSNPADKGGVYYVLDFDTTFPRTETPTKEHFQTVLRKVSGVQDVLVDEVYTIGTFTDRTKQLSTYCFDERVLFVGDAAHIHAPLGGQGLNLGLGDAMNLGWKVAAVVKGEAGKELLKTYEGERWEVGREVLEHTRAQTACLMPGEHGKAIRGLVREMSGTDEGATLLAEKFGGYDRRYDLGGDCWIIGRSAPDFLFIDGRRLGQLLEAGKWLLVDFTTGHDLLPVAESLPCWVQYSKQKSEEMPGLTALLVRPDGVVAWASEVSPDAGKAKRALSKWMKDGEHCDKTYIAV